MADDSPSKSDIQTIFKKLRAVPTNKTCFDCNAKNPTWSSVTYGVFICIDCSAVHRGLGVHVTFVRSTQLDTNWTWLQLRQMQLGGNANAESFFRQHNCDTTDAQMKYSSRAAQLYREKLKQLAVQAMKTHGTKLHLEPSTEKHEDHDKEVDFFEEHSAPSNNSESDKLNENIQNIFSNGSTINASLSKDNPNGPSPSVDFSGATNLSEGERKSIIGGRKPQTKRGGLGVKKGGLGAQKVNTNFAEIEREAEMLDQIKEKQAEEAKVLAEKTAEEEQKQMASMRLAYKDLSIQQKKEEEKLKQTDPRKAEQIERLGMGFAVKSGISHSALSDMQTIKQETPVKSSLGSKSTFDSDNNDDFFDDFGFTSFGMYRTENKSLDSLFLDRNSSRDRYGSKDIGANDRLTGSKDFSSIKEWTNVEDDMAFNSSFDEKPSRKEPERPRREIPTKNSTLSSSFSSEGDAQKKFGNAKAISSDQYFGDSVSNNWERKANLSRFEGSSSISSADFFGDNSNNVRSSGLTTSLSAPDLDDVKESVRQGVTKVAGKISSLANGVLSSIQDRYGY